jgi:hypothetical protein
MRTRERRGVCLTVVDPVRELRTAYLSCLMATDATGDKSDEIWWRSTRRRWNELIEEFRPSEQELRNIMEWAQNHYDTHLREN